MSNHPADALIRRAFYDAQSRRPYVDTLSGSITPPGGDWRVTVEKGAATRSVTFGRIEAALINARGDLDDATEGQIAMAVRATPQLYMALRAIIVLAENPSNLALIREIAISAAAFIETPAPPIAEPDEEG